MDKLKKGKRDENYEDYYMPYNCVSPEDREEKYFSVIEHYIKYYAGRARKCKLLYCTLNIIKIASMAAIPVFEYFDLTDHFFWTATMASSVSLAMEAVIGFMHLRRKWALYRDTFNTLVAVQRKYVAKRRCGYCRDDFEDFVNEAESVMRNEAFSWYQTINKGNDSSSEEN